MKKKKIKICFFSINAYALFNQSCGHVFGGAEIQLYQLANKFAEDEKFQISFFVADVGQKLVEKYGKISVIKAYPLHSGKKSYFKKIYHGILKKLVFLFKISLVNPDVCIHRAAGIETGILAFYCKLFRKKFIYMTAHEIDCSGEYEKNSGIQGKSYAYGIKNASAVITQSIEHRTLLKKVYGLDSVVMKNSYPISSCMQDMELREFVLWVARLDSWKQPEQFIAVAKKIPAQKFTMIAPISGDEGYAGKIHAEARLNLNLELIEKVPFSQIGAFFQKAKIFVNTSTFEGFPNTFVQAAMFGTPIVSLNVNPDNFLNEYACGYCADGDKKKLVESVEKLLSDENDWREKSKNAYRYAKENHDIENNIKILKEIINNLLPGFSK